MAFSSKDLEFLAFDFSLYITHIHNPTLFSNLKCIEKNCLDNLYFTNIKTIYRTFKIQNNTKFYFQIDNFAQNK